MRRIGAVTPNAQATFAPEELAWWPREWVNFTGGPEEEDWNVVMEKINTMTGTRI